MSEVTPLRRCTTCDRHFDGAQFCPDDGTPLSDVAANPTAADVDDAWLGRVLAGRYRVLGVLGRGGMGVVYEAEQRPFGRIVAIKRLRVDRSDEARLRARFEREALAVSRLKSPWTVRLLDVVRDESGEPFIVMERLSGESLRARLTREGAQSPDLVVRVIGQIARALAEAHAAGVVHRDLKPDNIILEPIGGRIEAKLLDFGIARLDEDAAPLTDTSQLPGTPHYLAPERIAGEKPGASADIYALGVVAYELLTGAPPYHGTPWEIMQAHTQGRLRPFAEAAPTTRVSPALEAIVKRMMARSPELRFSDGEALVVALESLTPASPPPPLDFATDSELDRPRRPARPRAAPWKLFSAALVGAAIGWFIGRSPADVVVRDKVVMWPSPLLIDVGATTTPLAPLAPVTAATRDPEPPSSQAPPAAHPPTLTPTSPVRPERTHRRPDPIGTSEPTAATPDSTHDRIEKLLP